MPTDELIPSDKDGAAPTLAELEPRLEGPQFEYSGASEARSASSAIRRGDRQRGGRRRRGRVADVQRALGGREDEVVDELAVAGERLRADAGEGGLDVLGRSSGT